MTPLEAAMRYVGKLDIPIYPRPGGRFIKGSNGWKDATRDLDKIEAWWTEYPDALIAMPCGPISGRVILDIDRKNGKDGFETLELMGKAQLPATPMVHTPNGGLHLHFADNQHVSITVTTNWPYSDPKRLTGLDVIGAGGSIALPTPGYGYRWDEHYHQVNTPFMVAPGWLRRWGQKRREGGSEPLDPHKKLADACAKIRSAGRGNRHDVLNREAFNVGNLVRSGQLDEALARHELEMAAGCIIARDFTARQAGYDLNGGFKDGIRKGGQGR
jgi:Bifunctional DNA primase/polymerase, N-terminal